MSKAISYVQNGEILDWINDTGSDVAYRDVIPSGGRIFVAGENIKAGNTGSVNTEGVYELPTDNTTTFTTGDTLYWDATNGILTKTPTAYKAGYATATKIQADTTAMVKIDY